MNYLLVFIGGGIGSLLRFGIAQAMNNWTINFPCATLVANILSAFLLGFVATQYTQGVLSASARIFFITGVCGGFSTFSTFTNETFVLLQQENYLIAFLNIFSNLIFCFIGLYLGMKIS